MQIANAPEVHDIVIIGTGAAGGSLNGAGQHRKHGHDPSGAADNPEPPAAAASPPPGQAAAAPGQPEEVMPTMDPQQGPLPPLQVQLPPMPEIPPIPKGSATPAAIVGILSVPDILRISTAYQTAYKELNARGQKLNEDAQKEQTALRDLWPNGGSASQIAAKINKLCGCEISKSSVRTPSLRA